jgi:hypothetical protein
MRWQKCHGRAENDLSYGLFHRNLVGVVVYKQFILFSNSQYFQRRRKIVSIPLKYIGTSKCLSQFWKFVERDILIVPTAQYWVSNLRKLWKCWVRLFFELTYLSVGLRPLACWVCGFESHRGHGYLSVVSIAWCQAELITRPEEFYRLCCVVVCDLETSWMRRTWPTGDCRAKNTQSNKTPRRLVNCRGMWTSLTMCVSTRVVRGPF